MALEVSFASIRCFRASVSWSRVNSPWPYALGNASCARRLASGRAPVFLCGGATFQSSFGSRGLLRVVPDGFGHRLLEVEPRFLQTRAFLGIDFLKLNLAPSLRAFDAMMPLVLYRWQRSSVVLAFEALRFDSELFGHRLLEVELQLLHWSIAASGIDSFCPPGNGVGTFRSPRLPPASVLDAGRG